MMHCGILFNFHIRSESYRCCLMFQIPDDYVTQCGIITYPGLCVCKEDIKVSQLRGTKRPAD